MDRYSNLIYKFVHKWLGIMSDGYAFEDLVQEGWAILAYASSKYNPQSDTKFSTYLYISLENSFKDLYVKYKNNKEIRGTSLSEEGGENLAIAHNDWKALEESIAIDQFLENLSEMSQKVLLYIINDDSIDRFTSLRSIKGYWTKLEKIFGFNMFSVKEEISKLLLNGLV